MYAEERCTNAEWDTNLTGVQVNNGSWRTDGGLWVCASYLYAPKPIKKGGAKPASGEWGCGWDQGYDSTNGQGGYFDARIWNANHKAGHPYLYGTMFG
jgi:hypothetical protein